MACFLELPIFDHSITYQEAHVSTNRSDLPSTLQFFSTAEVATILRVSRKLVNHWVHDGQLPAFRMGTEGRIIRIRLDDLEAFIAQNTALRHSAEHAENVGGRSV
jgi:excisionase family DNA binding protein